MYKLLIIKIISHHSKGIQCTYITLTYKIVIKNLLKCHGCVAELIVSSANYCLVCILTCTLQI